MKIDFKQHILPHLIALLIFVGVASVYNSYEWEGKTLQTHDNESYVGAVKQAQDYREDGEQILWTSRIFGGMPLFQVSYAPRGNLFIHLESYKAVFPTSIAIIIALMLGGYIAFLFFGLDWRIATLGALGFALSTWVLLSVEASHNSKVMALSYVPPLIGALFYAYKKNVWIGSFFTAIFVSFAVGANHYQITYYSIFFIAILIVFLLIKALKEQEIVSFLKKSFIIFIFTVLGVLANTVVLWTTYDYAEETIRGGQSELIKTETKQDVSSKGLDKDYAMRWSYGKLETFNLLVPGLYAGGYQLDINSNTAKELQRKGVNKRQAKQYLKGIPMYYGTQPFTSGPVYLGVIVIFLFFLLFAMKGKSIKWALLTTAIVALFFAWGHNFWAWNSIFFNYFPMFNKFRAPSMWLSMTIVSVLIGAMIALNEIVKNPEKVKAKMNYVYFGLAGVIAVLMLFGGAIFNFEGAHDAQLMQGGFPIDAIIEDRKDLLFSDALRTLVVLSLAFGLLWAFVHQKMKNAQFFILGMGILLVADLWTIDKRYYNKDDYKKIKKNQLIKATNADKEILKDKGYYRVFNSTLSSFNDNSTSYFHNSVGGYSAVKLFRYQDLIENQLAKGNMEVFNMLNTKYFIQGKKGSEVAQSNPSANGAVWFVEKIDWAKDAQAEMNKLSDFNSKTTAVIDERFKNMVSAQNSFNTANASISLTSFHPDKMEYTTNANSEQFAVFSEIWYKGNEDWKAYIDGKEVPFARVNYLLRGLNIPAGKHQIVFEFKPKTHYAGVAISRGISIVLLLFGVVVIFFYFKKNKAVS